ncbi:MAG: rhodanese-like domain-containing protein [Leptospiraceae bacterium]|nr:rhodanese-like domain-containing protein [Leptospiraceae bacterium]MDW8305832.1 rhodanese-like domain-containing protein [Leptospiraceae bacterium]
MKRFDSLAITLALLFFYSGKVFAEKVNQEGVKRQMSHPILEKIKNGAIVVDVRTPMEYHAGHYPGAINIPVDQLPARLSELDKKKEIIVYCASGARSSSAKMFLEQKGYKVTNAGGLRDMPR